MWSKRVSDLADITTICQPKWRTPLSRCQEAWDDFGWQSMGNFLRYGKYSHCCNARCGNNASGLLCEFGGASPAHFPRRMSRRGFPGRTFCFPPKNPKMSAGMEVVWCPYLPTIPVVVLLCQFFGCGGKYLLSLSFGRGARSTTLGSIFSSKVLFLFVICTIPT